MLESTSIAGTGSARQSLLYGTDLLSMDDDGTSSRQGSRPSWSSTAPSTTPRSNGVGSYPSENDANGELSYQASLVDQGSKRRQDIALFSAMVRGQQEEPIGASLRAQAASPSIPIQQPQGQEYPLLSVESKSTEQSDWEDDDVEFSDYGYEESTLLERFREFFNPTPWLTHDVKFNEKGMPYFDDWGGWTLVGLVRHFLFNPLSPEYTQLQQFSWAVILGIGMGIYTANWGKLIDTCVEFVWKTVPTFLLSVGVFTSENGSFPLYHYTWICPCVLGGILSYIFAIFPMKIPGQNEWISNVHSLGVQDFRTFVPLFLLTTAGMASGLSLGPELPLILTAGMIGSWLAIICQQSILQARVMNLTAASAAVAGFFGFPMAGALFVLGMFSRSI